LKEDTGNDVSNLLSVINLMKPLGHVDTHMNIHLSVQEGIELGKKDGRIECTRRLIALQNMDFSLISDLTNLPLDIIFDLECSVTRKRQLEPINAIQSCSKGLVM
jgi:hypothetical protein